MLPLNHFFDGTLRKEEVASAFLAMALEGLPSFRSHFFSFIEPLASATASSTITVKVEEKRVDVRLEVEGAVVLIENKVSPGAMQIGQMLKYYEQELRDRPDRRVVCVFLAPREVGHREVERVRLSPSFRTTDYALHLPWESLFGYHADGTDVLAQFVEGGLAQIRMVVEEGRLAGPYGREGERGRIRSVVDAAFRQLLHDCPSVGFHRWSGKNHEIIRSKGSVVTVYVQAYFTCEPGPPFAPRDTDVGGGRLALTIQSQLRLAGGIPRRSPAHEWWRTLLAQGTFDVSEVGRYDWDPVTARFCWEQRRIASDEEMAAEMARIARQIVTVLSDRLKSNSLSMGKTPLAAPVYEE
jgi:hypothetical protein